MSAFANYGTARLADNGKVILQQSWTAQIYVLAPNQDADHDGMPDDWEKYYQLDPNNAADAALDSDGDGISNLAEFQLRTDPKQPPGSAAPSVDLRPGIDTDGDGMPNVWEWKYGLNYNDASDALTDNDGDGLTNSQEYFIKTDPGVADMDGDGLTDGEEIALGVNPKDADSDHDNTEDGVDADPKDALVSWNKSPEAVYVLLDVEGSPDSDLPSGWAARDLNDKGEVLFVDGVWSDGGFTAKAFPEMVTRSVPDPEGIEPLNYNVEFQAYEKFNADGEIIGWAKTTFTTTPAAGGDPLTSSWSWDGTGEPVHLADTVIANQDSVRSVLPMGIDHQGRAFSTECQFGSNGEDRRRIVVTAAPGAAGEDPPPGGSAAGEQYIEPSNGYLVTGMDGHFDISRSGCIVTNTESPEDPEHPNAAKTYQLVMWNSSLGEVPLPAGTNGWHFPVHISDMPNNKPALAVTKSGDGGGSVYLQNPSGAMERSTNLSAQQIELFAGDGSAMTRDGRIWRNGKFMPLRELCEDAKALLDAGWTFHPLRANKHGTYLIQAEGPNGEMKARLAVPVEVSVPSEVGPNWQTDENADPPTVKYQPATEVNVATWEDSFQQHSPEARAHWWVKNDMDHVRVRILRPDKTGQGPLKVTVETRNPTGLEEYNDPANEVELKESATEPGVFENFFLLVSNDVDDAEGGTDEGMDDQTHTIAVGGDLILKYEGKELPKLHVPEHGRIRLRPLVLWYNDFPSGSPAVPTSEVKKDVDDIRRRYAQAGIAVDWDGDAWGIDVNSVPGATEDFRDDGMTTLHTLGPSADEIALSGHIKTTYPGLDPKDIVMVYSNKLYVPSPPGGYVVSNVDQAAYTLIPSFATSKNIRPMIVTTAERRLHTMAHETLHMLLDDVHDPDKGKHDTEFKFKRRLWSGGSQLAGDENRYTDRVRMSKQDGGSVVLDVRKSPLTQP